MRRYKLLIGFVFVLAPSTALAAVTVVTFCGQRVEGPAELLADLDCTGTDPQFPAVELRDRGVLRLNGFTITAAGIGVHCNERCRVLGPGSIAGVPPNLGGTVCSGATHGVVGLRATVKDVSIAHFRSGIVASLVLVRRSTVSHSCTGVSADYLARITDSSITSGGAHGFVGAQSYDRLSILRSTVTGFEGDLVSPRPPRVRDSTCATSLRPFESDSGDYWGVCS